MNKLLFIALIFSASCKGDYKEIEYQKNEGLIIQIDSSKYEQVLLMDKGDQIIIASKEGIKEVYLWEPIDTFFMALLIGICIGIILVLINTDF